MTGETQHIQMVRDISRDTMRIVEAIIAVCELHDGEFPKGKLLDGLAEALLIVTAPPLMFMGMDMAAPEQPYPRAPQAPLSSG